MKYSYSTDEERYHGNFDSLEEACAAALEEANVDGGFWIGENEEPTQPEKHWQASEWLENVSIQDEYSGDWADGWDTSTKRQREELEVEVRAVMAAWLDRHKLRPTFWNISNIREFSVTATGQVEEVHPPGKGVHGLKVVE